MAEAAVQQSSKVYPFLGRIPFSKHRAARLAVEGLVGKKPSETKKPAPKYISARKAVRGIRFLVRKQNWRVLDALERNGLEINNAATLWYSNSLRKRVGKLAAELGRLPEHQALGQNALMIMAIHGGNKRAAARLTEEQAVKQALMHGDDEVVLATLNNWIKLKNLGELPLQVLEFLASSGVSDKLLETLKTDSYVKRLGMAEALQFLGNTLENEYEESTRAKICALVTGKLMSFIVSETELNPERRLLENEIRALAFGARFMAAGENLKSLILKSRKLPNNIDALLLLDSLHATYEEENDILGREIDSRANQLNPEETLFLWGRELLSPSVSTHLMVRMQALHREGSLKIEPSSLQVA